MELSVKIRISDPLLRSYLSGIFDRQGDGFVVSMSKLTGTVICSLVRPSDRPAEIKQDDTVITFYLPRSHCNDSLRNKHLIVTKEATDKINAALRKEFDTDFLYFCAEARVQGYKQKDIIPIFLLKNKIDLYDGDIEAPKKRLYRKELSLYENLEKKLLNRVYLAACEVRKTMKSHLINWN